MSSGWEVGDAAAVINTDPIVCTCCIHGGGNAKVGLVFTVAGVLLDPDCGCVVLHWDGCRSHDDGVIAKRCRKIRPDKREACETEFVTLLKRSKQRVSA